MLTLRILQLIGYFKLLKETIAFLIEIEQTQCAKKQYKDANIDGKKAIKATLLIRL